MAFIETASSFILGLGALVEGWKLLTKFESTNGVDAAIFVACSLGLIVLLGNAAVKNSGDRLRF